ncbi:MULTISPECIES: EcsC family protein [Paenibacillus]|uniref:EcsC family protein n=1 Tax=Paenibacillus TaxID=44249 RepID=UPI0003629C61|nr:EcsC family protein [Paenibacillus massiliensis]
MDSRERLNQELDIIKRWEQEQKDTAWWDKLGRLPFALLDRVLPKGLKDKLATALNEVGKFVQDGGKYLVQPSQIVKLLQEEAAKAGYLDSSTDSSEDQPAGHSTEHSTEHPVDSSAVLSADYSFATEQRGKKVNSSQEIVQQLPLDVLDQAAQHITERRVKFAAAQGATTGIGGAVTMIADIPLVLGLSLKVLQEMALCYGFDPDEPQERVFIVKCLQYSSADIVGKQAILEELVDYDNPERQVQIISQIQGWREVVLSYQESFGWKKLFQLVPIAGMWFGSVSNRNTIRDVAEAGQMLYKKRLILQRLDEANS